MKNVTAELIKKIKSSKESLRGFDFSETPQEEIEKLLEIGIKEELSSEELNLLAWEIIPFR